MEDWIETAISDWKLSDTKLNPGTSLAEIVNTEKLLGFNFPEDFKQLYLKVNGFVDWDWQQHMFSLWPLNRIVEEYTKSDNNFVGFCDFLINSHSIGFKKDLKGIFKNYDADSICESFAEAIVMINNSSDLIY